MISLGIQENEGIHEDGEEAIDEQHNQEQNGQVFDGTEVVEGGESYSWKSLETAQNGNLLFLFYDSTALAELVILPGGLILPWRLIQTLLSPEHFVLCRFENIRVRLVHLALTHTSSLLPCNCFFVYYIMYTESI